MIKWEVVNESKRKTNGEIHLPQRMTKNAMGYDFYSPSNVTIYPHSKTVIFTDVKFFCDEENVGLLIFPRSSIGVKRHLMLANTVGLIDSDYYGNEDNDGNIGFVMYNYGDEIVTIKKGERIGQGMIVPFLLADNGNSDTQRIGGFGSSGR